MYLILKSSNYSLFLLQYILPLLLYTITYSSHLYVSWTRAIHCNGCYYIIYQLSIFLPLGFQTALCVPQSSFIWKHAWPLFKIEILKYILLWMLLHLEAQSQYYIKVCGPGRNMDEKESRRVLEYVNLKIIVIVYCKWTMNVIYYKWKILSLWFFFSYYLHYMNPAKVF